MASFQYGGLVEQVAITATAAGTTTLVNTSRQIQVFTGSAVQTIVLPDATTMSVGQKYEIVNQSSSALTLHFNGGSAFTDGAGNSYSNIISGGSLHIQLQTNGTSAGVWAAISSLGVATTISGTILSSQVLGVTDGSNAAAGEIGEYISGAPGAFVGVGTSGTFESIASISLTAGDWDVDGNIKLATSSSTANSANPLVAGGASLNSSSLDTDAYGGWTTSTGIKINDNNYYPFTRRRFNLTSTTTIYLICRYDYTTAGGANWGTSCIIQARRVR